MLPAAFLAAGARVGTAHPTFVACMQPETFVGRFKFHKFISNGLFAALLWSRVVGILPCRPLATTDASRSVLGAPAAPTSLFCSCTIACATVLNVALKVILCPLCFGTWYS